MALEAVTEPTVIARRLALDLSSWARRQSSQARLPGEQTLCSSDIEREEPLRGSGKRTMSNTGTPFLFQR